MDQATAAAVARSIALTSKAVVNPCAVAVLTTQAVATCEARKAAVDDAATELRKAVPSARRLVEWCSPAHSPHRRCLRPRRRAPCCSWERRRIPYRRSRGPQAQCRHQRDHRDPRHGQRRKDRRDLPSRGRATGGEVRNPTSRDSSTRSRNVLVGTIAVVVVALLIGVIVALTSAPSPTSTSASPPNGSRNVPGASGPPAQAFRTCLEQHGVTLPSGRSGGFGGGVPPAGGTPPSGGTGPGQGFGAGTNSKVGQAIAACRSTVGTSTPA